MTNNISRRFIDIVISETDIKSSEFIGTTGNIYKSLVSGSISYNTSLNNLAIRQRTSRANSINCITTWSSRTPPNNGWKSVCWSSELSIFVAVSNSGTGNRVMTSPNGITWNSRTSAADNDWFSVCWSSELTLFVAVAVTGTGNRVMTSSNGTTWSTRTTTGFDNNWTSVCWSPELSIFVATSTTGIGNRVMTSPDGITWTPRSTTGFDNQWTSVCWSSELSLFVAVAISGTGNRVMTSPNGVTWTIRTSSADNNWSSVCWSSELTIFVAVAYSGTGNRVMSSPDGINWTSRTSASDNSWNSVCWSNELSIFVAVSQSGTGNRVMSSSDGINWTTRPSASDVNWLSVCWSPEFSIFLAVGDGVMTSNIGIPNRLSSLMVNPGYLNVNNSTGNVGIRTSTQNAPLQFSNSLVNRKIVLYDTLNNDHQYYGFGINSNIFRYQTDSTGSNHVFYAGTSSTTSNELLRIKGNGNVGIGTSDPQTNKLSVNGHIFVNSSNSIRIPVNSYFDFGFGTTKETNAGTLGYQKHSAGLDILGAGTGSRYIKLWDVVYVQTSLQAPNLFIGTSKVHNKYSIVCTTINDILEASDFNLRFRVISGSQTWQVATSSGTLVLRGGSQTFYAGGATSVQGIGITATTTFQNINAGSTNNNGDKYVFTFVVDDTVAAYTFTAMLHGTLNRNLLIVEKLV